MRATAPSGQAAFENVVGWSGELGFGVRAPEEGQTRVGAAARRGRTTHDEHDDEHDAHNHGGVDE